MAGSNSKRPFPLPSEIKPVPGTEGWEEMYPYFTRVRPEDDQRFWFFNSMHFPEPMPAFDSVTAEVPYTAMGAYTTRVFAFPTALGIDYRVINGHVYITANAVTDPKEIEKRLKVFQERAPHYFQNWTSLYDGWKQRMLKLIEDIDAIQVPALGDFEDASTVTSARGVAENHFVRTAFHRTIEAFSTMWHHHFEFLMLGYGAYLVFFQFCKKAFPEIADQTVARMVAGIDVLMFRPDDELKKLARLAVELGIDGNFVEGATPDKILSSLRKLGDPGARWLKALEEARYPWFNIATGDGFYHHHRSWNDDLTVPFSALPRYVRLVKQGESLDRPTVRLKQERERIIAEYRALLTTDEDRGAFDQMLGLCLLVFPYVEDHKFYCEQWFTTRFFSKMREFGALLARWAQIETGEDVFHLQHFEVDQALVDIMIAWASGSKARGGPHWKPIIEKRKRILEKLKGWDAPPAIGPMPDSIEDPAVQMLWGITSETLTSWARVPDAKDANEIRGYAASAGIAEGVARVLHSPNDIGDVLEGEILVCPVTNPSWAPIFGKIRAAVSDIGGTMSHAAIVAREYGMPAVVGTGQATKRIRTGQRLRVDGSRGVVTLLD